MCLFQETIPPSSEAIPNNFVGVLSRPMTHLYRYIEYCHTCRSVHIPILASGVQKAHIRRICPLRLTCSLPSPCVDDTNIVAPLELNHLDLHGVSPSFKVRSARHG